MKAPDKIYVHELSAEQLTEPHKDYHLEYIRKEALVEWARSNWLYYRNGTIADQIKSSAYEVMLEHIESL